MKPQPKQPPVKDERYTQEVSADEAGHVESHNDQTKGGGHRSGSRGAGTLEQPDTKPEPGQGPRAAAVAEQ